MTKRFLGKDSGSGDGGCPGVTRTTEAPPDYEGVAGFDGFIVQGIRCDSVEVDQDVPKHEALVWVPSNVIVRAFDDLDPERVAADRASIIAADHAVTGS